MLVQNQKNSPQNLLTLLGITSATVLLSLPVLAFIPGNSNQSFNNRTIAQNTPNTNQPNTGGTGTTQPSPADSINNQQNRNTTNTNQQSPADSITNQQNPSSAGTTQPNPAATGTTQPNPAATGTTQQNPAATGTTQPNRAATNNQNTGQQDPFTQYMLAGYSATQQKDYQTALTNFQRALQLRPSNPYAVKAVRNVQNYLQRGG